jgi:hypothetical protein
MHELDNAIGGAQIDLKRQPGSLQHVSKDQ